VLRPLHLANTRIINLKTTPKAENFIQKNTKENYKIFLLNTKLLAMVLLTKMSSPIINAYTPMVNQYFYSSTSQQFCANINQSSRPDTTSLHWFKYR